MADVLTGREAAAICGLCTSCAARWCGDVGVVEHEDGCQGLAQARAGHDCHASATGFCDHPSHALSPEPLTGLRADDNLPRPR